MSSKQTALFDDRFLESYAGRAIIKDKRVALIELIANSWDAGATTVEIDWPVNEGDTFRVTDNGHGMTDSQFSTRFRTLAYNRQIHQGIYAEVPRDLQNQISNRRPAFGKNGKGRFAGFAFGEFFHVKTWRESKQVLYKVFIDSSNSLAFEKISEEDREGHGTEVFIKNPIPTGILIDSIKSEVGMRFLADPCFSVKINGENINFDDIPTENTETIYADIDGQDSIEITVIDVKVTDKTTKQHGIAWHVNNRLVGECTWKGSGNEDLIDGRRIAAKRYIYIVKADILVDAVLPDWTGFIPTDATFKTLFPKIQQRIKDHILSINKEDRSEAFKEVLDKTKPMLKELGLVSREKWETFITEVQEECPSISQGDLEKLGTLLAKLENTESKYGLIGLLSSSSTEDLNNLHTLLEKWNVDFAKIVLDEIEQRMRLVQKLQSRVTSENSDEVHELQPLFHRGLWIFGPEYETIEYTSNVGMTKVIQDLFGVDMQGSRNRPDFAILKDSSVGLYSYAKFDEHGSEIGIDRLTIVELKKPGIVLGEAEVNQSWKYVSELLSKGIIKEYSLVTCFVLGSNLSPYESSRTTKMDGRVVIQPLDYDTIMKRAQSRLLNLFNKVKNSPFLEDEKIKEYMREKEQLELMV